MQQRGQGPAALASVLLPALCVKGMQPELQGNGLVHPELRQSGVILDKILMHMHLKP